MVLIYIELVQRSIGSIPNRRLQVNQKVPPPNQGQWIESPNQMKNK